MKKIYDFVENNIDWRKGAFFGGLAGILVGVINCNKGIEYAFSSGGKEFAKCLAIGTMNISICNKLAKSIKNKALAYSAATIVPTIVSVGLTYGTHAYLKGTPYPLRSTAPTALSAPFFAAVAVRERRLYNKAKEEEDEGK